MMKRRAFLKTGSVAGALVATASIQNVLGLLQSRPRILDLPADEVHVRHGGWRQPGRFALAGMPELRHFQRNVFLANGCEASGQDLKQLRLQWKQEWVQVCTTKQAVFVGDAYHTRNVLGKGRNEALILPNGLHLHVGTLEQNHTLLPDKRALVVPLDGALTFDGQTVGMDQALVVPAGRMTRIEGSGVRFAILSAAEV